MKTYSEKLKDPRWQRKRLEILNRDNFTCKNCGDSDKTLHVHHKFYTPKTEIWGYSDDVYQTLCEDCHKIVSDQDQTITTLLFNDLDDTWSKQDFIETLLHCDFKILVDKLHRAIILTSVHEIINALQPLVGAEEEAISQ